MDSRAKGFARSATALERAYTAARTGVTVAPAHREALALASLLGGLCLANAGLGAVHGFAAPIGGMFDAPHGAVCAALLGPVMVANVAALRARASSGTGARPLSRGGRSSDGPGGGRYRSRPRVGRGHLSSARGPCPLLLWHAAVGRFAPGAQSARGQQHEGKPHRAHRRGAGRRRRAGAGEQLMTPSARPLRVPFGGR